MTRACIVIGNYNAATQKYKTKSTDYTRFLNVAKIHAFLHVLGKYQIVRG